MMRPSGVFDFNTCSTNNSSPSRTAPANTIVNLRSSGQTQQSQSTAMPSSAAAAYVAGKRTKKTTTTTTTTTVASESSGASGSRLTAAEATHEVVVSSPQVTHQVVRTKLPVKGKRTTTTTTTTTRRAEQGSTSTSGTTSRNFITSTAAGSSDGDSSGRSFGSESVPSSRSHAGLYAGPTSPASLRANHQAALDNLNQQRQLSSSSGEEKHDTSAVGIDRRGDRWTVYEDLKEL
ncbi:hypothetical protein ON010_g18276 [Phytophthora cinnamomi]|nr:hypothetical protein ON010_g18276 [Phytophthora cinnamomi]